MIEWKAGLLTVHAVDAPRQDVLREVARVTRTPILGIENASGQVTIELDKSPLGLALRALAGNEGHALTEFAPSRKGAAMRYELQISGPAQPVSLATPMAARP